MQSLWNDRDAARHEGELELRVYTSRLLGRDPALVLHGGGNTSVKIRERNLFGEEEEILYVKGSGWDLATIEAPGFTPVRMPTLLKLAALEQLSDTDMVRELRAATVRADAPAPSVEAILHAILPYRYVDHTHADAIVTVTNTPGGEQRIREIYGDRVVILPFCMPGFDLARLCAERYPPAAGPNTIGMVLLNHGIFSFADDARSSYERMIELVSMSEEYLARNGAWTLPTPSGEPGAEDPLAIATLRRDISHAALGPVVLHQSADPLARDFARHPEIERIARQGPATPDHSIRTKRLPMLGRDVAAYARDYRAYFETHEPNSRQRKTMLDPAPRVVLDPELGMLTCGRSISDARIAEDIYGHTVEVILRAEALDEYQALPPRDIFELEYWDLEQAKLRRGGSPPPFAGETVLVTGAASGIGKTCVESFRRRGANAAGLDIDAAIEAAGNDAGRLGIACDVTDEAAVAAAIARIVRTYGGIDMVVLNAGVFPATRPIGELDAAEWRRVMGVNLDANLALLRALHPYLRLAPRGARMVVIGSKNVAAPGPGAAAYSASKAALTQLARVAALEWARERIRVNMLHPDAVFDTGLWTEEVISSRAASYGMSIEQYKTKNLLGVEVTSHQVAELAAELCGPLFACTTGAQIPVDGGNDRVI